VKSWVIIYLKKNGDQQGFVKCLNLKFFLSTLTNFAVHISYSQRRIILLSPFTWNNNNSSLLLLYLILPSPFTWNNNNSSLLLFYLILLSPFTWNNNNSPLLLLYLILLSPFTWSNNNSPLLLLQQYILLLQILKMVIWWGTYFLFTSMAVRIFCSRLWLQ